MTDRAEHLTLFGLEVTKYCGISDEEMERLGSKTSVMSYYLDGARIFRRKTGYPFTLHDVLPICLADRSKDFNVGEMSITLWVWRVNSHAEL